MNTKISCTLGLLVALLGTACGAPANEAQFFGEADRGPFPVPKGPSSNRADLIVALNGPVAATQGASASYTAQVSNAGTRTASSAKLTIEVSAQSTLGPLPSGCTQTSATAVRCNLGNMAAGASASRTFDVTLPSQVGPSTVSALVSTTSREISTSNNSASLTTNVTAQAFEPPLSLPQTIVASDCFDVTSYSQCVPEALLYAQFVLQAGGVIDTGYPGVAGTWSQPSGASSIEMVFTDTNNYGAWLSTFSGVGISASCFEGSVTGAYAVGAFQACTQ